jgi:hypothetical protein
MSLGMMMAFNVERPVVWTTYQCYLKTALETVTNHLAIVRAAGCCFGAKIVRHKNEFDEMKIIEHAGNMFLSQLNISI